MSTPYCGTSGEPSFKVFTSKSSSLVSSYFKTFCYKVLRARTIHPALAKFSAELLHYYCQHLSSLTEHVSSYLLHLV
ncbi:hypothetical protein ATANTOWER_016760 [Ataeniobius toweri]|uniref:Uncharacterized protein n=1 Tax=Ataeniobius toweri TaxID=208326 RepID=A0ABU7CGZ6_9TELE|nr:hypothetical protein [Ataeniobius toweri]